MPTSAIGSPYEAQYAALASLERARPFMRTTTTDPPPLLQPRRCSAAGQHFGLATVPADGAIYTRERPYSCGERVSVDDPMLMRERSSTTTTTTGSAAAAYIQGPREGVDVSGAGTRRWGEVSDI